jgi:hypothetical protein
MLIQQIIDSTMAKEKLTLEALQVQSFVTALTPDQMQNTKGGIYQIRGRRYNYRVRWTMVDTRVDIESTANSPQGM